MEVFKLKDDACHFCGWGDKPFVFHRKKGVNSFTGKTRIEPWKNRTIRDFTEFFLSKYFLLHNNKARDPFLGKFDSGALNQHGINDTWRCGNDYPKPISRCEELGGTCCLMDDSVYTAETLDLNKLMFPLELSILVIYLRMGSLILNYGRTNIIIVEHHENWWALIECFEAERNEMPPFCFLAFK